MEGREGRSEFVVQQLLSRLLESGTARTVTNSARTCTRQNTVDQQSCLIILARPATDSNISPNASLLYPSPPRAASTPCPSQLDPPPLLPTTSPTLPGDRRCPLHRRPRSGPSTLRDSGGSRTSRERTGAVLRLRRRQEGKK